MPTIDEIRQLKTKLIDQIYARTRAEQAIDDTYINDTFDVPEISNPKKLYRLGTGREMVDKPAEQIVTSNPQAIAGILKGKTESAERISRLINDEWIPVLKRQNPNPFKETVKNKLGRGESYIKIVHNADFIRSGRGLPVHFLILEPMVVYGSPEEDLHGRPERVIVYFKRQLADVLTIYNGERGQLKWGNPKNRRGTAEDNYVEWVEYWDNKHYYFEADGEPVLKGSIQEHKYGVTPFVRKHSGFGRRSPDGDLVSLIVSDIRFSRDLLRLECAIQSDIATSLHLFSHPRVDLFVPEGVEVDGGQLEQDYDMGPGAFNALPEGIPPTHLKEGIRLLPTQEAFQHSVDIRNRLVQRNPFIPPL